MLWEVHMSWPILRCHHKSGSSNRPRTVSIVSTTSRLARATGNEKSRWNARKDFDLFLPGAETGSGGSRFPQALVVHLIGFGKSDEPMKVGPGDTQSACGESLVAIILADSVHRKFHFVFLYLPFERTR